MKLLSIFTFFKKKRKPSPTITAITPLTELPTAQPNLYPFFSKYRNEVIQELPKAIAELAPIEDNGYCEYWLPVDGVNYFVVEQCGIAVYTKEGTTNTMTATEFYETLSPDALSDFYEIGIRAMRNEQFDVLGFLKDRAAARRN